MTRNEAKRELLPIKEMEKDILAVEQEIERLMTVATKMTTNYTPVNISGSPSNRVEDALIKVEEYRARLSNLLIENISLKNRCWEKVQKVEPNSLRRILVLYFFQNKTMEQTAEVLDKSYQWTYELYKSALDEYAKIS